MPNYQPNTEKNLLLLASEGNEAAFEELFFLHKDKLYAFSLKITGHPDQAQDMVQDVFLRLWKNKSQLDKIENLSAFIFKMVQNKAVNQFKRMAREQHLLLTIEQQYNGCESATELHTSHKAMQHVINDAVKNLPPQQHLVFKLSKEEGLKLDEIAGVLNISRNTVKNHLAVAIRAVRKQLRLKLEIEQLLLLLLLTRFF